MRCHWAVSAGHTYFVDPVRLSLSNQILFSVAVWPNTKTVALSSASWRFSQQSCTKGLLLVYMRRVVGVSPVSYITTTRYIFGGVIRG